MLDVTEHNEMICIRVGGKLSANDYQGLTPVFERIASRGTGTVPLLIEVAPDFSGWDLGGI